ncbi:SDR family NAD(P)-dependent oxidoreductase [bacterium]|nr:MAG: SDR family NAD(P)-dependent oxidoreductase [bacterium]
MEKVVFITGSSRGLGAAIAKEALARGYKVAATARNAQDVLKAFPDAGEQLLAISMDVTDVRQIGAAVDKAIETFGRIDVVINNAGYGNVAPIEHVEDADFHAQMNTNFYGVYNVTKAVLPQLHKQRAGHIIQVSSIGGRHGGTPGLAAYQSAKFAVAGFSKVLAAEVAPFGIKVTILEPGGIRTDWAGSSMKVAPLDEEYQATIGWFVEYREKRSGQESGDPERGARITLDIAENENPPLHLLLGHDAVRMAGEESRRRSEEAKEWEEISFSFDFLP